MKPKNQDGLGAILQQVALAVVVVGKDGRIALNNPFAEELFGYESGGLHGRKVEILIPAKLCKIYLRKLAKLYESQSASAFGEGLSLQLCHHNGTIFPVELRLARYQYQGQDLIAAFVTNVVNRTRKEEQLQIKEQSIRLLIEHTPAAVAMFDQHMRYIMVSRRWLEDYGLDKINVEGISHYELFPEIPERWKEIHRRALSGETLNCEEDSFIRQDGRKEWLRWQLCPWYTKTGSIGGVILFTEVITQRKNIEEEQRRLNDELEEKVRVRTAELATALARANEMNEMKSAFVTMASHEFRTPLSAILSSAAVAEMYKETSQQDKREKHFARIKSSVLHLVDILDDFLSLEKLEQGKTKAEKVLFNLREQLQDIIDEMNDMQKKGQIVRLTYTGAEEVVLDKKMLRNIVINLLSNALKYSDKDVNLDVDVSSRQICIIVRDKGIGIPEAEQKHIMDKFFRASNALNITGTGLGLNIVKHYINLLGGTIRFSSKEGEGTTLTMLLPSADIS